MDETVARQFREQAVRHLTKDFLPKIRHCLGLLSDEEIWWRPNQHSNSVGNMLLHLSGNVRQWVTAALGGAVDMRRRDEEFETRGPLPKERLAGMVEDTVAEAVSIIENLEPHSCWKSTEVRSMTFPQCRPFFMLLNISPTTQGRLSMLRSCSKTRIWSFTPSSIQISDSTDPRRVLAGGHGGKRLLRSPMRPNPIGSTEVTVEAVEGTRLRVSGLDALDGSPVVDIKKAHRR